MFERGEKVVCVNGDFSPSVRRLYRQLPVKDHIYTIRDVGIGRVRVTSEAGANDVSYLVLLEELHNPDDPYMPEGRGEEMGFRSDRFAPLVETSLEEHATESIPAQYG